MHEMDNESSDVEKARRFVFRLIGKILHFLSRFIFKTACGMMDLCEEDREHEVLF